MEKSILEFQKNGIPALEKVILRFFEDPTKIAEFVGDVQNNVLQFALNIIAEQFEAIDEKLRNSGRRKKNWEIVKRDEKTLTTSIGDLTFEKTLFRNKKTGEYRYLEFENPRVKRQLGLHHLRENIGDTPLKLDDLELLAIGPFLCKDTTEQPATVLSTAFSNTWWSLTMNRTEEPDSIGMRGAFKESRTFRIGQWKDFSGAKLPTLIKLSSANYQGDLWIRSAYLPQALSEDPVKKRYNDSGSWLFRKVPGEGKRKIPLILKLNQELLRN